MSNDEIGLTTDFIEPGTIQIREMDLGLHPYLGFEVRADEIKITLAAVEANEVPEFINAVIEVLSALSVEVKDITDGEPVVIDVLPDYDDTDH